MALGLDVISAHLEIVFMSNKSGGESGIKSRG
jgi:hypothetical protein